MQPVKLIHLWDNWDGGKGMVITGSYYLMSDWDLRARAKPEKEVQWSSLGQWCCHERRKERELGQTLQNWMSTGERKQWKGYSRYQML